MRLLIFFCFFFLPLAWSQAQTITPEQLLAKSIEYHDPAGIWGKASIELQLTETRPGAKDRKTKLQIDLPRELFVLDQLRDEHRLESKIQAGTCTFKLDGNTDISDADLTKHRFNCERTATMRDYYTYLWGLPMKLQDPGTQLGDQVEQSTFQGQNCLAIRVTYSPEVGKDIWYFYFHPETYALIGYRFYHDEAKNDGEYITLEGETTIGSLRLPQTRKWYTHSEEKFLGADILNQ
ncbi:MAG: DUF6503 family protein [Bacteroidota bacterium]